jgi:zinc/manganese transport system substrate-binding protein
MIRWRNGLAAVALAAALLAAAACNGSGPTGGGSGRLQVVAAENFWGSIAQQLGGDRVRVTSIISNPATDPHSYEPTAADARTMSSSQMAIVNGVGYDTWASQLLAASPAGGRVVLNVGSLVGVPTGANPHRWYFPANVFEVAGQITRDYQRLDPAHRAYYAAEKHRFETVGLAEYTRLRRRIRARYAGVPVGYSESIFQGLGQSLGLKLLTPYSFAKAIAEGTEPTPQDVATMDRQITGHEIKVWIINSQNSTPDVARLTALASSHDVPTTAITETLSPAGASFQRWQVAELRSLAAALAKATGR